MSGAAEAVSSGSSRIAVRKIGVNLGAEIAGIDLRQPLDDRTASAIHEALAAYQLLVFRDQEINSEQLIAFGRCFGELTVHPFSPNADDAPVLIKFENQKGNPPALTDVWHSDETFRETPPMATALCAKEVPELGGDTMYVSMTAAYEGLSDRMQSFISGLEAVHDFKPFRTLFSDSAEDRLRLQHYERLYPPAVHPVVRIHPVDGRKAIFVNPQFTVRIKGMEERESRSLLDTLFHQALIPEYQLRHHWRPHTIAMWDNRSTQHYAIHDYYPQRRFMERVTIKGDRPFGPETADPASIRRAKIPAGEGIDRHGGHRVRRQFERDADRSRG